MPDLAAIRTFGALLTMAALTAAVTSCSSDRSPTTGTHPTTPASSSPADVPISGVLTFSSDDSTQQSTLFVHDPATGKVTRTLTVPGIPPYALDTLQRAADIRSRFTADWNTVTWARDGKVYVAQRQADTYVVHASWKPQETFEQGRLPYRSPTINTSTGRIWFREDPDRNGKTRVLSVDPQNPAAPPRVEQAAPTQALQFDNTGKLGTSTSMPLAGTWDSPTKANVVHTSAGILSATVHVSKHGNSIDYTCPYQPHWKTTASLPCFTERQGGPFGSVAILTINKTSNTADLRQAVPSAGEDVNQVVFSPDARQARIELNANRWVLATLDDAGSPQPIQLDGGGTTAVAWVASSARGIS